MLSSFRQQQIEQNQAMLHQLVLRLDKYSRLSQDQLMAKAHNIDQFLQHKHKFMEQSKAQIEKHLAETLHRLYIHNLLLKKDQLQEYSQHFLRVHQSPAEAAYDSKYKVLLVLLSLQGSLTQNPFYSAKHILKPIYQEQYTPSQEEETLRKQAIMDQWDYSQDSLISDQDEQTPCQQESPQGKVITHQQDPPKKVRPKKTAKEFQEEKVLLEYSQQLAHDQAYLESSRPNKISIVNPLIVSQCFQQQQMEQHSDSLATWPFREIREREVVLHLFQAFQGYPSQVFSYENGLFCIGQHLQMSHLTNGALFSLLSRLVVFLNRLQHLRQQVTLLRSLPNAVVNAFLKQCDLFLYELDGNLHEWQVVFLEQSGKVPVDGHEKKGVSINGPITLLRVHALLEKHFLGPMEVLLQLLDKIEQPCAVSTANSLLDSLHNLFQHYVQCQHSQLKQVVVLLVECLLPYQNVLAHFLSAGHLPDEPFMFLAQRDQQELYWDHQFYIKTFNDQPLLPSLFIKSAPQILLIGKTIHLVSHLNRLNDRQRLIYDAHKCRFDLLAKMEEALLQSYSCKAEVVFSNTEPLFHNGCLSYDNFLLQQQHRQPVEQPQHPLDPNKILNVPIFDLASMQNSQLYEYRSSPIHSTEPSSKDHLISLLLQLCQDHRVDLQQSMTRVFLNQVQLVSHEINSHLIAHLDLIPSLARLDEVLLMKQPFLWDSFMEELVFQPVSFNQQQKIVALDRLLLDLSPHEFRLTVHSARKVVAASSLKIQVAVPFPLDIVLSPQVLETYQKVVSYLMQLNRAERCLVRTQPVLMRSQRVAMHKVTPIANAYNLDQTDAELEKQMLDNLNWQTMKALKTSYAKAQTGMANFLLGYKGYLYGHLLRTYQLELESKMKGVLSLDAIREVYSDYVMGLSQATFSNTQHQEARAIFEQMFQCCWTFYKQTQKLEETLQEMQRGWEQTDPQSLDVMQQLLMGNYGEFLSQGAVLVQSMKKSASNSGLAYVQDMYTSLNFNQFFVDES